MSKAVLLLSVSKDFEMGEKLFTASDVRFNNFMGLNLASHAQAGIGITTKYALMEP